MSDAKQHPYHLVDPSPWPLLASLSALIMMIGLILTLHNIDRIVLPIGIVALVAVAAAWWRDVYHEADEGHHTGPVRQGLRIGMLLFILSEVMLFFTFFWAYFNAAFTPTEVSGMVWPPKGIKTFDPFHLPYFNTLLLLMSGTTVTWAHHALLEGKQTAVKQGLLLTIALGALFTCVQVFEYAHAAFALKDGIYPSTFYIATGFHGAHVIIGTIFLITCFFRARAGAYTPQHHVGFEAAAWYWHFVDVVWLFLFISIYWWGYRPEVTGF